MPTMKMCQALFSKLCPALLLITQLSAFDAFALSDNISLSVTNPWTKLPVTLNLQRYSLRATNYQVRIYSDVSTFTLLPANQIPEVTTYRGRIAGDPGAFVAGAFKPNGSFYYNVSYGCRWQDEVDRADPYDGTNRLSWSATVATTNIPSLGYTYTYQTNMPVGITWSTNNYPAPAVPSFGGPPYLNNLQQVPLQRVRLLLDSDLATLNASPANDGAGGDINAMILMQESRINDLDYEQARDLGLCYSIAALCVRTNTQSPFNSSGFGKLSDMNSFWSSDPGFHTTWDMAHGTVNVGGGGVAFAPGDISVMDPSWWGGAVGHEIGHNWRQSHYAGSWDYTGDNFLHVTMSGSGLGHCIADVGQAQDLRRNSWKGNLEWVRYNYPVAPWAGMDLATTKTNLAVTINVLLNDRVATSNTLSIVSFETNTPAGGTVTHLGNGQLRYTPAPNFSEPTGLKSLTGVKVLVTNEVVPLLAQWNFEETTGSVATNSTGNGGAVTLGGSADFASGPAAGIGGTRGLHLDGNGYLRFKGTWLEPLNTSMTFSFWIKPDAAPAGDQMLLMKSSLNGNASSGYRIGMNATSFYCSGNTLGALKPFNVTAPGSPQPGNWYHVVVEFDRTSNLARLWVNGVESTSTSSTRTIAAGEFIAGENWPVFGAVNSSSGWGNYFQGTLDDLRVYTKALTQAEINAIYQSAGSLPAGGPIPADGERDVALTPLLKWTPGRATYQHDVFLGTNLAAVTAATTNSPEYVARRSVANYAPGTLLPNTTYYWRVDEIVGGTNVATGSVWNFVTAPDTIHGGLKLQYTLDARDTLGNITYDRGGPPFQDGTLNNTPAPTSGQAAEALQFDGTTSQYVQVPALNLATDTITMLAWVRRDGVANLSDWSGVLFHRGSSASGLNVSTANRLGYHWNNAPNTYNFNSGLTLPADQWVLTALVVETNRAVLYLGATNGTLTAATNNVTHAAYSFDGGGLRLASDSAGGTRYLRGSLDEVGIWNRALSRAEIGVILTNGMTGGGLDGPPPAPQPGTYTWTGNSDSSWANAGNWSSGVIPTALNTAIFDESSAKNMNTDLGQPLSIAGALITGKNRALGIASTAGNALTVGSGGIQLSNSFTALTLAAPVSLSTSQTWGVSEFATLNINSNISGAANSLTLGAEGNTTLNGVFSGSGSLIKRGDGTATITVGPQTFTGGITVSNGTLKAFGGQWAQSFFANVSPRTISVHSNATFETTTHSLGGLGAAFYQPIITLNDGATWQLNAEQYLSGGNLVLKGATISILANDLRIQGSTVLVNSSALPTTVSGAGSITLHGDTTFNVANGPLPTDAIIDVPIGNSGNRSLTKSGTGTLALTESSTFFGPTTVTAGTLALRNGDNRLPPAMSVSISSGAILDLSSNNQTIASLHADIQRGDQWFAHRCTSGWRNAQSRRLNEIGFRQVDPLAESNVQRRYASYVWPARTQRQRRI
jgi:autotransporter-associated beta strand protein